MVISVGLFILANATAILLGRLLPPMAPNAAAAAKGAMAVALVLGVYKLVIVRLGERPRDDLPLEGAPRGVAIGLAMGFLLFCALVGIAALFDVYNIVGPGDAHELIKDLIGMTVLAAFMEEMLFRGILFRWIEEFGGSWAALVVTSALFGLAHIFNANATWTSSLAIMVEAGMLLGGAYMLARNLWVPMGLHAAWNFTKGFILDVEAAPRVDEEPLAVAAAKHGERGRGRAEHRHSFHFRGAASNAPGDGLGFLRILGRNDDSREPAERRHRRLAPRLRLGGVEA